MPRAPIRYDAGPPCHDSAVPAQQPSSPPLRCSRPKGHGGPHEHSTEADGRSAYRRGGPLDLEKVPIGALGLSLNT